MHTICAVPLGNCTLLGRFGWPRCGFRGSFKPPVLACPLRAHERDQPAERSRHDVDDVFPARLHASSCFAAVAPVRGLGIGRDRCLRRHARQRAGQSQARAGGRDVGTVRQVGRGDRARSLARDRRNQRQGRRARPQARAGGARRREQSGQGCGCGARTRAAREGGGVFRRPRHAGLDRDRAVRQPVQGAVHGSMGGGHADHAKRRGRELRVPRLRGRRAGRQGPGRLRGEEIRRQEARHDPDQQSLGRVRTRRASRSRSTPRSCRSPASRSSRPTTSTSSRN